jgi:hypothetical protein
MSGLPVVQRDELFAEGIVNFTQLKEVSSLVPMLCLGMRNLEDPPPLSS